MIHIIIMISIRQFTHGFTVIKSGCFFLMFRRDPNCPPQFARLLEVSPLTFASPSYWTRRLGETVETVVDES